MQSMKRVTVKDIARASGYSVGTVSKTLNGTDRIGAETVEKIKKIAAELGYRSSFSAQSLARKARKVAILLFQYPDEVRRLFETGFNDSFSLYGEFGIEPVYYRYDDMREAPWKEIEEKSDALISTSFKGFEDCFEQLDALGKRMPLVMLQGRSLQPGGSPTHLCDVSVDAQMVGMLAAQFLSLCAPKRKTAIITGYSDAWIHNENVKGFLNVAPDFGIENVAIGESFDRRDYAYEITGALLDKHPELDGIFVTTFVSPAVCRCIQDKGRSVHVVGVDVFEDTARCLCAGEMDAAIFQNQQKQAQLALECVVNQFRGLPVEPSILVKPELVLKTNLSSYL